MNNAIADPAIPPIVGTIQNAFVIVPAINRVVISIGMIVPPITGVTIGGSVNSHKRLVGFNEVPSGQVEGAVQISASGVVPGGHEGATPAGWHKSLSKTVVPAGQPSTAHRGTPSMVVLSVRVVPVGHNGGWVPPLPARASCDKNKPIIANVKIENTIALFNIQTNRFMILSDT